MPASVTNPLTGMTATLESLRMLVGFADNTDRRGLVGIDHADLAAIPPCLADNSFDRAALIVQHNTDRYASTEWNRIEPQTGV